MNDYKSLSSIKKITKLRLEEIKKYLSFIKSLEENQNTVKSVIKVDIDVINIQKNTVFIMLYNIIEYSIYSGIYHIYYVLGNKDFNKLRKELKEKILSDFISSRKRKNEESLFSSIVKLQIDINQLWARIKQENHISLISGSKWSIDYNTINKVLQTYWMDKLSPLHQQDYFQFCDIKHKRNNLSHWSIWFSDEKNTSQKELMDLTTIVENIIFMFFDKIALFIKEKHYLRTSL